MSWDGYFEKLFELRDPFNISESFSENVIIKGKRLIFTSSAKNFFKDETFKFWAADNIAQFALRLDIKQVRSMLERLFPHQLLIYGDGNTIPEFMLTNVTSVATILF